MCRPLLAPPAVAQVKGIAGLPSLQLLDLSHNAVQHLDPLQHLPPHLKFLQASRQLSSSSRLTLTGGEGGCDVTLRSTCICMLRCLCYAQWLVMRVPCGPRGQYCPVGWYGGHRSTHFTGQAAWPGSRRPGRQAGGR